METTKSIFSPAARVFYISLVLPDDHRVLSQCRLLNLLIKQIARRDWLFDKQSCKNLFEHRSYLELFQFFTLKDLVGMCKKIKPETITIVQ